MLKADFHIHTRYSLDCDTTLNDIIERCETMGITCIAVSDHGTVDGALRLREMASFPVIVAEEVLTPEGEIMGMFLEKTIPRGISVEEAIERIREQDGLVCLPHPFDPLRGLSLDAERMDRLAKYVDVVEVFNARSTTQATSDRALEYALKHDIPGTAGSDAHSAGEIGHTFVEMPEFNDKTEFLEALRQGKISQHKASVFVHLNSTWAKIKKKF